jgi:undecaprenyl-diphosphatase
VTELQALFFGIIQGLCEFFPISSSAHLSFFKYFFHISNSNSIFFELICNLGTTFAAIIFLRKRLLNILKNDRKTILFIFLALLPLFPMYFFFNSIKAFINKMELIGLFFILTSVLLFLASTLDIKKKINSSNRKIKDVLFIGLMQTLALIPGVSRSGSTITAGCFRGWEIKDAISFSFILAIPTVLGGNVLEGLKIYLSKEKAPDINFLSYIIGFLASFFVGLYTIKFIFSIVHKKRLLPFAWYCFVIGVISLIYFNMF